MSLTPVLVTIQRPSRTGDGGGGKAITWATVGTGMATQNFYGRTTQLLKLEQAAHNAQGPGNATKKQQLFTFEEKPFPAIRQQDRIVSPDGNRYVVQFVRTYDDSLQVDTELVS